MIIDSNLRNNQQILDQDLVIRNDYLEKTDAEQRQIALDPYQSFIVQAPAGSGKTELLIQRFLTLLACVEKPEEILALTFTKKAANEMKRRIMETLKKALVHTRTEGKTHKPLSEHAAKTFALAEQVLKRDQDYHWQLFNMPHRLQIQTIDSFCANLIRICPLSSECGPNHMIVDDPSFLYHDAICQMLRDCAKKTDENNALATLLHHLDNDIKTLEMLFMRLLGVRDQWLPYLHLHQSDHKIKAQLSEERLVVVAKILNELTALFPPEWEDALCKIIRFASNHLKENKINSPLCACYHINTLPKIKLPRSLRHFAKDRDTPMIFHSLCFACHEARTTWIGIANLLLTEKGTWRKIVNKNNGFPSVSSVKTKEEKSVLTEHKQLFHELISALEDDLPLQYALHAIRILPTPDYKAEEWSMLIALLSVLKDTCTALHQTFNTSHKIDYIENTQAALRVLEKYSDHDTRHAAFSYAWRHVLIDEFQDTSIIQYRLFKQLIAPFKQQKGDSVFIVGDPMQSIYRFRQAEVGLFMRLYQHGLETLPLIPLRLSFNFRSSAAIIHWVNHHFKQLFPQAVDIAQGAICYAASLPHAMDDDHQNALESAVMIQALLTDSMQKHAKNLVSVVQQLQAKHPEDNIAILVRSRRHLICIIQALKQEKLMWRAVELESLSTCQVIQDALALTCAFIDCSDRVAWLALLRAPWCGLQLADLLHIAEDQNAIIFERLLDHSVIAALSPDAKQRLSHCIPILKTCLTNRSRDSLSAYVENAWLQLGADHYYTTTSDQNNLNTFFELLTQVEKNTIFVSCEYLKQKIKTLFACGEEGNDQLQIMTMHAAKGLEFDSVIIPHLECMHPYAKKPLLASMEYPLSDHDFALLIASLPKPSQISDRSLLYEYIEENSKQKVSYEEDRLLYVAVTRAKKRLYLCFNILQDQDKKYYIPPHSFLKKLWPIFQSSAITFIEQANQVNTQDSHLIEATIQSKQVFMQNTVNQNTNNAFGDLIHSTGINRLSVKTLEQLPRAPQEQPAFNHSITLPTFSKQHHINRKIDITPENNFWHHASHHVGTVVHHVLQQLALFGIAWWAQEETLVKMEYLRRHFSKVGLLHHDQELAVCIAQRCIENTIKDERGRWIISTAHQDAKTEYALTTPIQEKQGRGRIRFKTIIIDRTFLDETQIRWIIDYKITSSEIGESLENFLEMQQAIYRSKMHGYHRVIQAWDSEHRIRLGLYFPALVAWREWSL